MPRLFSAFGTAFVAMGFICAPLAALVTFIVYGLIGRSSGPALASIAIGLLVGLAASVAIWWAFDSRFPNASAVNPQQYELLGIRLRINKDQIDTSPVVVGQPLADAARRTAASLLVEIDKMLQNPQSSERWLSAEGYLEAWDKMYRLEEAMYFLVPVEQVFAMVNHDLSRLDGSDVANAGSLTARLNQDLRALAALFPAIAPPLPAAGAGAAPPPGGGAVRSEYALRADFATVRRSIDEYRQDQWIGLVNERNRVMLAAAIAGLFAYFGLISVVSWSITPKALEVAVSFIITGALISLLHQVTIVGGNEAGIEDFGQSTARLLSATFVSGLIALLGVIVLQGVGLVVNGMALIPPFTHWKDTFDWTQNRGGYFVAAIFGLTPSLLFQILQNRADAIMGNLQASQSASASN